MGLKKDVSHGDITQLVTIAGLDKVYEVKCSCGFYRDFGYMWQTAERFMELHQQRNPDHELTMVVEDAPPLSDVIIRRRFYDGRAGHAYRVVTLKVEPGLT
jgi:hypothetical protein